MKFVLTVIFLALFAPLSLNAAEGGSKSFDGFISYAKNYSDYVVNPDGTHTETHEVIINVLTDSGVDFANQVDIGYSESLNDVKILSAYTLKKDGKRIDVPARNIQERAAMSGGGPMYSDIKTKVIIFPDVAVGDKVGYSYRYVQKEALFPGQFSMTQAFTKFVVLDDVRISVSVPTNTLQLRTFATGVKGGRIKDKDGRMRWVWTFKNPEITTPEIGSVAAIDYGPRLIVSSFKDYGDLASAYEDRAKPKAAVTEKTKKLADKLTQGITDHRKQAKILYTWVAQNIRYAGNCIGIGSVVPHDSEMVLSNRLGDCKDHTALLQALLAAKGIKSTPVLVNSGSSYKLPKLPAVSAFNHVINFIPELNQYIDSTAQYTPFGILPIRESGKPVIHTAAFSGIKHTPPSEYKNNRSQMTMTLRIHEDGSADGETHNEENGVFTEGVRALMANIQPNLEDNIMRSLLSRRGYTGTGTLIKSDPTKLSEYYTYGSKFHIDNALNIPGPGAFILAPIFPNAAPVSAALFDLNRPERTIDYSCFGGISTETYTIELPKNVKVFALPENVHLSGSTIIYDTTYSKKGNTITALRHLEDKTSSKVCTAQDDREYRPLAQKILKDLKAQIIYR